MNQNTSSLPWTLESNRSRLEIHTGPDKSIALPHSALADAELIVTACNSHAALLGALEAVLDNLPEISGFGQDDLRDAVNKARQSLALAKGVQQ